MSYALTISGWKTSIAEFRFKAYYKTSEEAEWAYVATGAYPFQIGWGGVGDVE